MQRTGVWTREEEAFAEALVAAFHDGQLDIQEGRTLRKFLAEALMCLPKRVSKKYEGSDYKGKQTYRMSPTATREEIAGTQQALSVLKQRFLNSIKREDRTFGRSQHALSASANEGLYAPAPAAPARVPDPPGPFHQAGYSDAASLFARLSRTSTPQTAGVVGAQAYAAAPNAASRLPSDLSAMLDQARNQTNAVSSLSSRQLHGPLGLAAAPTLSSSFLSNDARSAGFFGNLPEHLIAARMRNQAQGGSTSTNNLFTRLYQPLPSTTQANEELFHRPTADIPGENNNSHLAQMGARWMPGLSSGPTIPPFAGLPSAAYYHNSAGLLDPNQARALSISHGAASQLMATQLPFLGGSLETQDNLASNIGSAIMHPSQNTSARANLNVASAAPAPPVSARRPTSLVMREVARRDKKRHPRVATAEERKRASDDDDDGAQKPPAKRRKRGR